MPESSEAIGDAVRVKLAAELTGWTVVRRKAPTIAAKDERPLAVVCVGEEGDVEHLWAGNAPADLVTYPVTVQLYFDTGGDKLGDEAAKRATRRLVRGWLNSAATYASVDGFNEVIVGGRAVFGSAAMSANQVESVLAARVQVIESRGN